MLQCQQYCGAADNLQERKDALVELLRHAKLEKEEAAAEGLLHLASPTPKVIRVQIHIISQSTVLAVEQLF